MFPHPIRPSPPKCAFCRTYDAELWVITCDNVSAGDRDFIAEPLCEQCRPVAASLVAAGRAERDDDVAMFPFVSGQPDI